MSKQDIVDVLCESLLAEIKSVCKKAEHDFLEWCEQQPVRLVELSVKEFEEYVSEHWMDAQACDNIATRTIAEIEIYARVHKKIKPWVESHEIMQTKYNQEISWRLRTPAKETQGKGLEHISSILRRAVLSL